MTDIYFQMLIQHRLKVFINLGCYTGLGDKLRTDEGILFQCFTPTSIPNITSHSTHPGRQHSLTIVYRLHRETLQ